MPSEKDKDNAAFGEGPGHSEDKEFWRVKHLCRSGNGSEIYDLVWSPDGTYILTGSMDNIARIYDSRDGLSTFLLSSLIAQDNVFEQLESIAIMSRESHGIRWASILPHRAATGPSISGLSRLGMDN